MSYMQFRQQCIACQKIWNAAFGMVGHTIIAQAPAKCPHCGSKQIVHYADGWDDKIDVGTPKATEDQNG